MKIGQPINELSPERIREIIKGYKEYTDFNRLGLFRGLLESERITAEERAELQELAIAAFNRYFDFLVIKDSETWWKTLNPGWEAASRNDRYVKWRKIEAKQEAIIKRKGFGHRNFGNYSKHNCCYKDCPLNGIMVKKNDIRRDGCLIWFKSDPTTRKFERDPGEGYKRRGKHRDQAIRDWEAE